MTCYLLLVRGEVEDLGGHLAVDDLAYGVSMKPYSFTPGVGGQRADQADVRAFRGLDGHMRP